MSNSSLTPGDSAAGDSPAAIISGGSAGVGKVIAAGLLRHGYAVTVLGRDPQRLTTACMELARGIDEVSQVQGVPTDVTSPQELEQAVQTHLDEFGRLDVLVNVVGKSDRGRIDSLDPDRLRDLFETNVISALLCSQECLPALRQAGGVIVNIGSLASRVAPRYLGGYAIVKHALAGMTRQLRLECEADGVHVGLVCPGPIEGTHGLNRYGVDADSDLPAGAAQPGGGAKLKRLSPDTVADAVLRCIDKREIEIILPKKTRLLMAINAVSPSWADWILSRKSAR